MVSSELLHHASQMGLIDNQQFAFGSMTGHALLSVQRVFLTNRS
jgi:hypothetical protein